MFALRISLALTALGLLASCASSAHVLVGEARPPISPDQVKVYFEPPGKFERIATLDASSGVALRSEQGKVDVAIARLKREAAKLGANGIVLEDLEDGDDSTVGANVTKGATSSDGQPISLNLGTSTRIFTPKFASGLAIYVPDN